MPNRDPAKRSWDTAKGMWHTMLYAIVFFTAAPALETILVPLAATLSLKVISRTDSELCFAQKVEKYRDMRPKFFAWTVRRWYDPDHDTDSPVVPDFPGQPDWQASDTSRKGEVRIYNQCIEIPDRLRGLNTDLVIEAVGSYRSWHGLWLVERRIGPYLIIKNQAFYWR